MNQNIDAVLAEQSHQLDKERQRLADDLNGLHFSNGGSGDNGGATDHYNDAEPASNRSNGSTLDADKQQKEELNQAISDQKSESNYPEPPRTGRRFVRPQVPDQSDSFYSHFPSFNNQNKQREQLVQSRHQEYKDHLVKVAQKEATETKRKQHVKDVYNQDHPTSDRNGREELVAAPYSTNEGFAPPVDRKDQHDSFKHAHEAENFTSAPPKHHDPNAEYANDAMRRKLEYQRDLRKQIDERRLEQEALRARDKAEEAKLTKRFEEQLRAIQLEEELRRERKRTDQARIAHEQNHIYRMHLLSKLDHEKKLFAAAQQKLYAPPFPDEATTRIVQSDHGRETQTDDRKVYQYFSNSAQYPSSSSLSQRIEPRIEAPIRSFQAFQELDEDDEPASNQIVYAASETSSEYCKRCQNHLRPVVCNYCERRRNNLPFNEEFCLKCSVPLSDADERAHGMCRRCRQTDLRCGFCQKHIDVCPNCSAVFCLRCHRRQLNNDTGEQQHPSHILELTPDRTIRNRQQIRAAVKAPSKQSEFGAFAADSDSDHDVIVPSLVHRSTGKPFSTNVPHTSIFHPKARVEEPRLAVNIRNGEIFVEELENKLAKYARNYSDLRTMRQPPLKASPPKKTTPYSGSEYDPLPVPLMPVKHQSSDSKPIYQQHRRPKESTAVQRLKQKWEIPAVQKNVMTERPVTQQRVLTQLGAIRKQLQLEQMELDSTYVKYAK